MGVLLQPLIQAEIAVHAQHKDILAAVLGKVGHQAELVAGAVRLHNAVGAAQQKQGVAVDHPLAGHLVAGGVAVTVQHTDVPPFLDIRHRLHHTRCAADIGLAGQVILLPAFAVQRAEKVCIGNVAHILEPIAGVLALRQAKRHTCSLSLFGKLLQLGKAGGYCPAVLLQQGLVVGDAVAVVDRGKQINGTVVRDLLQAGFNVIVGEIIARKVDELVAHVIGHRVIDRDGADVRQVMGLDHILDAGGRVVTAVGNDLDIHFRVDAVDLVDKGLDIQVWCHKGDSLMCRGLTGGRCSGLTGSTGSKQGRCGEKAQPPKRHAPEMVVHHLHFSLQLFVSLSLDYYERML